MPYRRRRFNKKRPRNGRRRVRYGRSTTRVPRPATKMVVYNFTRDIETNLDLSRIQAAGAGPLNFWYTSDGGIAGTHSITLDELPLHAEFTPLFKQYRIMAVKTYMYPAANSFTAGTGVNTQNNNVMIRMSPNQTGTPIAAGNEALDWNQLQAKKRWIVRPDKPIMWYTRLKQKVDVHATSPNISYAVAYPKFVDTYEDRFVEHYGMNLRFDPVDFTNPMALNNASFPVFKVIQKVYFQMKGVK